MPKRIPPLSDTQINKAKPREKEYKLSDGYGLYLLVTPTGGKLWRMGYRFDGKQKGLAFGSYPEVTLAAARDLRKSARELLAIGVDPIEDKKAKTKTVDDTTLEFIAREWHTDFSSTWVDTHALHKLQRLEKHIFPYIGNDGIGKISAPQLLETLRRIPCLDTAHRIRYDLEKIFTRAIATGRGMRNSAAELKGVLPPVENGNFAAPTNPVVVAPILLAIDGYDGSIVVKSALQVAPMLFVRPGELRHMEWTELDFELLDGGMPEWNIPGCKMKGKKSKPRPPHLVPLPHQAVEILKALKPLTGHSRYVFPCHRSSLRPMSENAVNAALRRMGFQKDEITGHGFRAMARTILDEVLGVRPDFIEHQLAHAVKDPNGRAYNRTAHLVERRKMMQLWADYLDGLKAGGGSAAIQEGSIIIVKQ